MVVIPAYQTAVTLFGRDGSVCVFPSKQAARRALGLPWIQENVGRNFRVFSHTSNLGGKIFERHAVYVDYPYVMRDDFGGILTAEDFATPSPWHPDWSIYRRYPFWNGEGPVPGLFRWHSGHYFRHPKTLNERRLAIAMADLGEVPPRARRNHRNLVTANDDLRISARKIRNWKRYRRTQWR
jgi:hypothetical protein